MDKKFNNIETQNLATLLLSNMEKFNITSAPLPGSEKIYVQGSRADLKVPMRKIKLSPTIDTDGSKTDNEDVIVYDTSGPYTDPGYTINLAQGLPKIRQNWIEERQDTLQLEHLSSEYGRMRQADKSLDSLRFEHVNTHPRIAKKECQVTQMYYARQGIITPEMEYIAIRENQLAEQIREKYKKEKENRSELIYQAVSHRTLSVRKLLPDGPSFLPTSIILNANP